MKYLLDTHILLWFITNSPELKGEVREIIINPDNEIYLSVVSEWELVIKSNHWRFDISQRYSIDYDLVL